MYWESLVYHTQLVVYNFHKFYDKTLQKNIHFVAEMVIIRMLSTKTCHTLFINLKFPNAIFNVSFSFWNFDFCDRDWQWYKKKLQNTKYNKSTIKNCKFNTRKLIELGIIHSNSFHLMQFGLWLSVHMVISITWAHIFYPELFVILFHLWYYFIFPCDTCDIILYEKRFKSLNFYWIFLFFAKLLPLNRLQMV